MSSRTPVHFAVVGLGNFAQTAILPAFAHAHDKADLVGLVTGDVENAAKRSPKYKAPGHSYDDYDALLGSGQVEAVYIAVPNSDHRKFAEPAARAGVHVLCEKPLAYMVDNAQAIVLACQKHKVRLMTAYRLHFEEGNLAAIEAVHSGKIGEVTIGPGQSGLAHRHPGPGFVYVLEGEYELGIDDQPTKVFKAGETFYEPTGHLHRVSKNPSARGNTRLIAVVLHPREAKEIAIPEKPND